MDHGKEPKRMLDALIVEDDADVAQAVGMALALAGYTTAIARHGAAALALLPTIPHGPRCIIADLELPFLDGAELIAALAQTPKWRAIPVILMTAERDPAPWLRALPCVGLVRKPFHLDDLLALLSRALAPTRVA